MNDITSSLILYFYTLHENKHIVVAQYISEINPSKDMLILKTAILYTFDERPPCDVRPLHQNILIYNDFHLAIKTVI